MARERKRTKVHRLYYHVTEHFNVKWYIQNETAREGGDLTWDKLVEEAKHQECIGKEYARFRRENSGGGTPSYGDPALSADAISRGYKKAQVRSQTLSGGKGGNNQQQCQRCGRHSSCNGEKGTCPAWGKECGICKGHNHYKAVCRKAAKMPGGGGPQQKQGSMKKPPGKAKAKFNAHSMVQKMVLSEEVVLSERERCKTRSLQKQLDL